jgi:adenylate cyclase
MRNIVRPIASASDPAFLPASAAIRLRHGVWALAAAVLAAAAFAGLPSLRWLEERSRDALTALAVTHRPAPHIVVVDISEASLQRVGNWPWPRGRLADLVEQLLGPLGARAVALDMVLPEPADAAGDARLASIATHGPLTLAQVLDFGPRAVPIMMGTPAGGLPGPAGSPRATGYVANHAGLAQARCVGHIGVEPDADGVLRRVHLRAQAAGRTYSTLALALLECADPALARQAVQRLRGVHGDVWRIPFRRAAEAFETVPAEAVLAGEVPAQAVRGRYVLIGSSAVGLSDYIATPLQPVTAGVLVHGQILAELLDTGEAPGAYPQPGVLGVLGTAAGLALLALGLWRGMRLGLAALALAVAGWLAFTAWAFGRGLGVPVLAPVAAFTAFAAAWTGLAFAHSRLVTRQAMSTLSHYVAQPVLRLLVRQGLERSLAPSRRQITVLVADMAGYTRLTAESTLEESARLTTEFLEAITQPVLGSGGTLDRYTGDGLIAFWGAPLQVEDHASRAHRAALQMLDAVAALNARRGARGEAPLSVRVGLESGEALVGDLGSSTRSVYTAVGTCINLASRLQEIAREMGEVLVIGPQAREAIRAPVRPLGPRAVRGLAEPIELYGLAREGAGG